MPIGNSITVRYFQSGEHWREYFDPNSSWFHLGVTVDACFGKNIAESTRTQMPNGVLISDVLDASPHRHLLWHWDYISSDLEIFMKPGTEYKFKNVKDVGRDELPRLWVVQGQERTCLGWITPNTTVALFGVCPFKD